MHYNPACEAPEGSQTTNEVLFLWSILCNLTSLMQKKFDVKWKSDDISGSASLALWANMNQSTTQLGSRRQSQGKPAYLTFNVFKCCRAVIICSVNIYLFFFSVIFAWVFIFVCFFVSAFYRFVVLIHFHEDGLVACRHLTFSVTLEVVWCSLYVLSPWTHTFFSLIEISVDLFKHSMQN